MSALRLFIQPPARNVASVDADEALILVGDNWNDFSYRTLYTLYYKHKGKTHQVGRLKILKDGQREGSLPLPVGQAKGLQFKKDLISLGTSIDYYVRLIELGLLDKVRGLFNDLSSNPKLRDAFAKEPGLTTSIYRDHIRPEDFYDEIARTVAAGGAPPGDDEFTLTFTPTGSNEPITFALGGAKPEARSRPSRRAGIIIGPNGVGKTHLLASIARVAYAPPAEREQLAAEEGVIADGPGFPNILAVSYSSFDNFVPPMLRGDDPAERRADFIAGRGRYIYLGMRDPAGLIEGGDVAPRLLTQVELANTFASHVARIRELDRFKTFAEIMQPVLEEVSVRAYAGIPSHDSPEEIDGEDFWALDEVRIEQLDRWFGDDPAAAFMKLSSGHKIVLHQLAGMTAMLQQHGLVLIDEPETHLHPPLLAALMSAIRRLLSRQHAYALVATHSPVVAQEALADQVVILAGREPTIAKPPSIETYGENVGALSREVFGFYPTAGDYRNVLDRMVRAYSTVEGVEAALGSRLSSQALAHVMATIARRAKDAEADA